MERDRRCALCRRGKRRWGWPTASCERCRRLICTRHTMMLDGSTVCTRCLAQEPAEVRATALRAGW